MCGNFLRDDAIQIQLALLVRRVVASAAIPVGQRLKTGIRRRRSDRRHVPKQDGTGDEQRASHTEEKGHTVSTIQFTRA